MFGKQKFNEVEKVNKVNEMISRTVPNQKGVNKLRLSIAMITGTFKTLDVLEINTEVMRQLLYEKREKTRSEWMNEKKKGKNSGRKMRF